MQERGRQAYLGYTWASRFRKQSRIFLKGGRRPSPQPIAGKKSHRRFSLRITTEGAMLLLVVLLVGFAAWHSGTNLLYLIFSILIALYLVHGFMLSLNLHRLEVSEILPEIVVADQPFDVSVIVTNRKRWFPSYALRIAIRADGVRAPAGTVFFPVVSSAASSPGQTSMVLPGRGLHSIRAVALSTRYPFGFEERSQTRTINVPVLALPPTFPVAGVAAAIPFGFGDQESNIKGSGTDLYGLREYVAGEHARHVHWRTSARMQVLMVSEYARDERRQIVLLLDNGLAPELHSSSAGRFENAVVLTASLARHLMDTGFEVGLVTADVALPVGQGPAHLLSILRHLAIVKLAPPHRPRRLAEMTLQITYHSNDDTKSSNGQTYTIDSTTWSPPHEQFIHGEKQL